MVGLMEMIDYFILHYFVHNYYDYLEYVDYTE